MSVNGVFQEVQYIEAAIGKVREATGAINRLQELYVRAYTPQEESNVNQKMQQIVQQTNQINNTVRGKLQTMERAAKQSNDRMLATQRTNLAKKFMDALGEYHKAQVTYQRQQQDRMRRQYLVVRPNASEAELQRVVDAEDGRPVFSSQMVSQQYGEARRVLQNCQSRHEDIVKIANSITQLQQLFLDMQTMVQEQDAMVINVSNYTEQTAVHTTEANKQLKQAVSTAKRNRKLKMWLCCCCIVMLLAIGLVVYFTMFHDTIMASIAAKNAASNK